MRNDRLEGAAQDRDGRDAEHIATFSPTMVLKLLDCVEAALEFYAGTNGKGRYANLALAALNEWENSPPKETGETK